MGEVLLVFFFSPILVLVVGLFCDFFVIFVPFFDFVYFFIFFDFFLDFLIFEHLFQQKSILEPSRRAPLGGLFSCCDNYIFF